MLTIKIKSYLLFYLTVFVLLSCNQSDQQPDREKYENACETLLKEEQKNPAAFITVSGGDKRNLLGQTVVKGAISNHAKVAGYMDIQLELSFYSETKTLLETAKETLYFELMPGETKEFKTKYFAPKGADSVGISVLRAKLINK